MKNKTKHFCYNCKIQQSFGSLGYETHEIGVIAINPEQSKHLETATTKVFGLSLDFVNLRKESYGQSRIPTIVTKNVFLNMWKN